MIRDDVRLLARRIWEERGRPSGLDEEIWLQAEAELSPHLEPGPIMWTAFSGDGSRVVTAHRWRNFRLWRASDATMLEIIRIASDGVMSPALTPRGLVLARLRDVEVEVRDLHADPLGGHLVFRCTRYDPPWAGPGDFRSEFEAIALSPDGGTLAVATHHVTLDCYDSAWRTCLTLTCIATGETVQVRSEFIEGRVRILRFSPDGRQLVLGAGQWPALRVHSVQPPQRLWGHAEGPVWAPLPPDWPTVHSVTFSGDSRTMATALDRRIACWETDSGTAVREVAVDDIPQTIQLSDDGSTLAAMFGCCVRFWDVRSGALLAEHGCSLQHPAVWLRPDGSSAHVAGAEPSHPGRLVSLAIDTGR